MSLKRSLRVDDQSCIVLYFKIVHNLFRRYFKIVHPLHTHATWTVNHAIKICLLITITAALLSLPRTILGDMLYLDQGMPWDPRLPENYPSNSTTDYQPVPFLFCFEDLGPNNRPYFITVYNAIRIVVFYFIPLIANFYIYRSINKALKQSQQCVSNLGAEIVDQRKERTEELMRMLKTMVIEFAVCWFPYQGFLIIQALDDRELFSQEWFQKTMVGVSVFLYLHCLSSPLIYVKMNKQFRKGENRHSFYILFHKLTIQKKLI